MSATRRHTTLYRVVASFFAIRCWRALSRVEQDALRFHRDEHRYRVLTREVTSAEAELEARGMLRRGCLTPWGLFVSQFDDRCVGSFWSDMGPEEKRRWHG